MRTAAVALLVAGGAAAVVDWAAVARGPRRLEYAAKPATLVLLVGAAAAQYGRVPTLQWAPTVAALVLSLVGDVLLMLPVERFVAGLAAFLAAHLCYAAAFVPSLPPVRTLVPALAVALLASGTVFFQIRRALVARDERSLILPVGAYAVAIALMLAAALTTLARPAVFPHAVALAAVTGAALFVMSDSLLAWDRFVFPTAMGPLGVIVLYHLAQICLVLTLAG